MVAKSSEIGRRLPKQSDDVPPLDVLPVEPPALPPLVPVSLPVPPRLRACRLA